MGNFELYKIECARLWRYVEKITGRTNLYDQFMNALKIKQPSNEPPKAKTSKTIDLCEGKVHLH